MSGSLLDEEREYLPLSRLSQAEYCLRRAALLMNEQLWQENADTARGRLEHSRAHDRRIERRGSSLKLYDYEVVSEELCVSGKCDCIEAEAWEDGCLIPAADFPVRLYPVEYKHGTVREESSYCLQLCAQAMALEEMYHTHIPEGALFFISAHRRMPVVLDDSLRQQVRQRAKELLKVRDTFVIPPTEYGSKCKKCSLKELCMPKAKRSAAEYCQRLAREATGEIEI